MSLQIHDMTVTWRHCLDLGALPLTQFKDRRGLARRLHASAGRLVGAETPLFTSLQQVALRVCSLVGNRQLILPLRSVDVAALPRADQLSADEVRAQLPELAWRTLRVSLLLHQSGVACLRYEARFDDGLDVEAAVAAARLGLETLVIRTPAGFARELPEHVTWVKPVVTEGEQRVWVGSLRDVSSHLLRGQLRDALSAVLPTRFGEVRSHKLINTTLIEITDAPAIADKRAATRIESLGRELRGIGSLDVAYATRADQLINEAFSEDLSHDEELGLYLLGASELVLFDQTAKPVLESESARLGTDPYLASRYISGHYACLLEWIQLERFLIGMYDSLMSRSMTRDVSPDEMLALQRSSMQDLLEYGEGITPYATRAACLEHARQLYRLGDEQQRLEKKRDVVADYVMQKYSLRTNNGIALLNLIVSATVAFEVIQLGLAISESSAPLPWAAASSVFFIVLLVVFLNTYNRLYSRPS